jgi:hypothetical protein
MYIDMSRRTDPVQETEDRQLLIRYLLEDLSEGEQDRVEERYFVDDGFYTKLLVAEDELIDSYVQDELSPGEREKFEQVYLTSPSRLKKVEANRQLLNMLINPLPPAVPERGRFLYRLRQTLVPDRHAGFRYALAGLLLFGLLCGLSGWLLFERGRMRSEMEQAQAQWRQKESEYQRQLDVPKQALPAIQSPAAPSQSPEIISRDGHEPGPGLTAVEQSGRASAKKSIVGARVPPPVVAFAFPHPGVRALNAEGNGPRLLIIPRGAILIRLTIDIVPNEYAAYSLSLQKVGGPVVWTQSVPRNRPAPSADQLAVDLPATLFQSQDYILQITASDLAGEEEILARHQITTVNRNLRLQRTDGSLRR